MNPSSPFQASITPSKSSPQTHELRTTPAPASTSRTKVPPASRPSAIDAHVSMAVDLMPTPTSRVWRAGNACTRATRSPAKMTWNVRAAIGMRISRYVDAGPHGSRLTSRSGWDGSVPMADICVGVV